MSSKRKAIDVDGEPSALYHYLANRRESIWGFAKRIGAHPVNVKRWAWSLALPSLPWAVKIQQATEGEVMPHNLLESALGKAQWDQIHRDKWSTYLEGNFQSAMRWAASEKGKLNRKTHNRKYYAKRAEAMKGKTPMPAPEGSPYAPKYAPAPGEANPVTGPEGQGQDVFMHIDDESGSDNG